MLIQRDDQRFLKKMNAIERDYEVGDTDTFKHYSDPFEDLMSYVLGVRVRV